MPREALPAWTSSSWKLNLQNTEILLALYKIRSFAMAKIHIVVYQTTRCSADPEYNAPFFDES